MLLVESSTGLLKKGNFTEMILCGNDFLLLSYVTQDSHTRLTDKWDKDPNECKYLYKIEQQLRTPIFFRGPILRPIKGNKGVKYGYND